ncbi:MAG: ABC transporter ATP-binding protein [Anaerolineales bacterium]|nr:ABC transporter ATP-binding protein [Anaerolineales bacterium]
MILSEVRTPLLQATDISHQYGSFRALAPINLTLRAGEILVLEGPNGSGKSTLLLCLSGLLRPATGEVRVEGYDLYADEREAKRRIAFVPDVPRFYTELTAWEHLRFLAQAHDAMDGFDDRAEQLLKELDLWEARDLFPHLFSRGMSLKLGLAFALIRPFKVLLLDEPTSALDEESTQLLIKRVSALREQGVGILLSTHDPGMKLGWADRVWTIRNGTLTGQKSLDGETE